MDARQKAKAAQRAATSAGIRGLLQNQGITYCGGTVHVQTRKNRYGEYLPYRLPVDKLTDAQRERLLNRGFQIERGPVNDVLWCEGYDPDYDRVF
jgi:hypothetical protein